MQKNKRQAEATKVGAAPTDQAQSPGLTIIQAGEQVPGEDTTATVVKDPKKVGLNLDETMKLVEYLHLKKRYRDRLDASIELLQKFEIKQKDEDLDERNYYNGCKISIKDDAGAEFLTKNPAIIGDVIKYLMTKFVEKRTEIEASIVLPY